LLTKFLIKMYGTQREVVRRGAALPGVALQPREGWATTSPGFYKSGADSGKCGGRKRVEGMAKYIARPVEVDAWAIREVRIFSSIRTPQVVRVGGEIKADLIGYEIEIEDGQKIMLGAEMTARMTPNPGDYYVKQADGYVYLNPKEVFERKYSPKGLEESGQMPDR
jgi:hypothetical protein